MWSNAERNCKIPQDNFWVDYEWISPSRFGILGRPIYKPEFWDKVQELDQWTNKYDPIMTCQPMGIPRQGTPRRIFQTVNDITMLYTTSDYGGGNREFRVIPTDGRKHDPKKAIEATYYGIHRGAAGRATRWCSTPSRSSIRRGWDAAVSSIPATCTSWRNSRARAMKSFTKSPSKTPSVRRALGDADANPAAARWRRSHCRARALRGLRNRSDITNQLRH